jgi:hypothetical protein
MLIQPIVEGWGEMEAVPVLLRRLQEAAGQYGFDVARPIKRERSEFGVEQSVRRFVRLALGTPDCGGILIVFDSDDDAACTIGPNVQAWAQAEAGQIPCQAVAAKREYEAWFISAIESLRGVRGIAANAVSHPTPETPRNAKGVVQTCMAPGRFYSPRVDQAALTARLDLSQAHTRCRSFKKMIKAFGVLAAGTGNPIQNWPPANW